MKHFARLGIVSLLLSALSATTAIAQTNAGGSNSWLPEIQPARQYFLRLGWASLKMNNKSEAAYDTTGPVYAPGELSNIACAPIGPRGCLNDGAGHGYKNTYGTLGSVIFNDPDIAGVDTTLLGGRLGIPDGVAARASDAGGAFGSVGMYLDENQNWAVEALVLGLPFSSDIDGAGAFEGLGKIITTKFLPPSALLHYYFGRKGDKFRPSVSAAVNYTIFFDTRSTSNFEAIAGGKTKVSLKNSLGVGAFVGGVYNIDERWSLNANLGMFKVKTEATITTYDTHFDADSVIFSRYPTKVAANLADAISSDTLGPNLEALEAYRNSGHQVNGGANLGNFTRKQKQTLNPYVLFVSVGYNF